MKKKVTKELLPGLVALQHQHDTETIETVITDALPNRNLNF